MVIHVTVVKCVQSDRPSANNSLSLFCYTIRIVQTGLSLGFGDVWYNQYDNITEVFLKTVKIWLTVLYYTLFLKCFPSLTTCPIGQTSPIITIPEKSLLKFPLLNLPCN